MDLSSFLVREFANLYSKDNKSDGTYAYGTVSLSDEKQCVTLDGSSVQTPVISSTDLKDGDRVMVLVKDHSATVMSNLTSPAVGNSSFSEYKGKVSAAFDELTAKYIAADEALIGRIESEYVKTSKLESDYITADSIATQYVKTSKLESDYLKAKDIEATYAKISKLESNYLTADEIKTKSADIELANVTQESVKNLFANNALIRNAVIDNGVITGQLMGVTMSANQITAGRIDAGVIDVVNLNAENITFGTLKRKNIDTGVLEDISNALTTAEDAKSTAEKSIKKVDVEYSRGSLQTEPPTTGWQTNAPDWEDGYYIWQRTATTLGDGTVSYSEALCITGIQGATGPKGDNGTGVTSIIEQYYLSTSSAVQSDGTWQETQPAWSSGHYIWTRSHITWTNGTTSDTTPVLANGLNSANQVASSAQSSANETAGNFAEFADQYNQDKAISDQDIKNASDAAKTAQSEADAAKEAAYHMQELINAMQKAVDDYQTLRKLYMDFSEDTSKGLIIGGRNADGSDNAFKTQITNTAMNFVMFNDVIAYISNQMFQINRGVVREWLRVGNFVLMSEDGNFNIKYQPDTAG